MTEKRITFVLELTDEVIIRFIANEIKESGFQLIAFSMASSINPQLLLLNVMSTKFQIYGREGVFLGEEVIEQIYIDQAMTIYPWPLGEDGVGEEGEEKSPPTPFSPVGEESGMAWPWNSFGISPIVGKKPK